MINWVTFAACFALCQIVSSETFEINMDLPATQRYTEISRFKKESIHRFMSYLHKDSTKYKAAFALARSLSDTSPHYLREKVGEEFYDECYSIARGCGLPISEIIVFNYMYELGAANDFCTAITISSPHQKLLGRNLDYGFQQFLINNSVRLQYKSQGKVVFETLGHAGFVGTHTAFRPASHSNPLQYAIVLNERVSGGLHLTIEKIMSSHCETSPYATMKALRNAAGSIDNLITKLTSQDTCSAVYWTILNNKGEAFVVEKNRGVGSHHIRAPSLVRDVAYLVQTNHDWNVPDPDGRSTAANRKITAKAMDGQIDAESVWGVLEEPPNFNNLTLMSTVIDVKEAKIEYKLWP